MHQVLGDGAWCWFQDPRAVHVCHRFRRTYATWITRTGALQVGVYDHDTRHRHVYPLKSGWGADDHGSGSLLVLPDRRLMIFYSQHNGTGLFCRTTAGPEDCSEWDDEVAVTHAPGLTYSNPVYLSDEGLVYVFWRGMDWKPTYANSPDGKRWSRSRTLIRALGRENNAIRPYVKIASDGKSAIHVAFTGGHPRNEAQNSIYYLKYEGQQFHSANGTGLGGIDDLPIPDGRCSVVYDGKRNGVRSWIWDLALDKSGRPVIAYTRLPAVGDHRYHYARWNGEEWTDMQITPGGRWFPQTPIFRREREPHYSGGIALDHADPSIAYLSRPINGVFEIEKWITGDHGASWAATPITGGSRQGNVRPVVPRGFEGSGNHVLWMQGRYVHYTNYNTAIRMCVDPAA